MACITLLSDLGLQDASVAMTKGILMQRNATLPIIDISHEISPYNIRQAAYLLSTSYNNFPEGTYHIVLFDVYANTLPQLVLHTYDGHNFLAPNNGLLPLAFSEETANAWLCYELAKEHSLQDWIKAAADTISQLQNKTPVRAGLPATTLRETKNKPTAQQVNGAVSCDILHIDQYENIVLNITKSQLEAAGRARRFTLSFMQVEEISEISSNYSDVAAGYKLCRFNSNGFLEICINRGKAASLFGVKPGSKYNDIKLVFE
jgi:S-adenosylmethionine hydrolase